jgi:hypothetical protein
LELTIAVFLLTVPVVGTAIRTLLMFAIGLTALLPTSLLPATVAAITVATIAAATDVENGSTAIGNAEALPKNTFMAAASHPHPIAGWTSRPLS